MMVKTAGPLLWVKRDKPARRHRPVTPAQGFHSASPRVPIAGRCSAESYDSHRDCDTAQVHRKLFLCFCRWSS